MNTWNQVLKLLEPQIDALTSIMTEGQKIEARTIRRPVGYDVIIVDDSDIVLDYDPTKLTERINWVESQLLHWKDCSRLSWDTWHFKNSKSHEKFMMMYYLKWQL